MVKNVKNIVDNCKKYEEKIVSKIAIDIRTVNNNKILLFAI